MIETTMGQDRSAIEAARAILARHGTLLTQEAFSALLDALAARLSVARLSVVLLEEPEHLRLYVGAGAEVPLAPAGSRLIAGGVEWRAATGRGEPYVCDDTHLGGGHDPAFAAVGLRSYRVTPLRGADGGDGVIGGFFVFFARAGAASEAPTAVLDEVAALVEGSLQRAVRLARERRLARILETSGDAMLAWDADGVVTDANAAALALTGRSRRELIGASIEDLLGHAHASGSTPHGARLSLASRAGEVPVSATITAFDGDPSVAGHALLRDVSAVVRAEREAAESLARVRELEEQHRALLDAAPMVIVRIDPATGDLDYLNRRGAELFGVAVDEALATPGFLRDRHADPDGLAAYDSALSCARRGAAAPPYEARIRARTDAITCLVTLYPLRAERGKVVAIEATVKDASSEQAARSRLVSSDRLATLGVLATGVAHEINNPAAFIVLGLDMLDRLLRGPGVTLGDATSDAVRSLGVELRESIRRIVDITRDLRLFASSSAGGEGKPTVVDVNRTVESALSLTRGKIVERARVERQLGDVPPVLLPDGRLAQVVVNLLLNAAQAIPRSEPGDSHEITVVTRSDGRVVEIEVRDTGAGIPAENLARIWQPFFSTKPPEAGTGLGLSICREIVERAGGVISAQSPVPGAVPQRGSRFVVALPAAGPESEAPPASAQPSRSLTDGGRVLLVDDEPALARVLAEEIGRFHEVVTAPSATAALELLARGSFDAVLCDLQMPGMSGEALFAEVCRRDEPLSRAFIFMTGVGFGAHVERFLESSGRPVLEKPFATEDALALLAKVLRARQDR